MPWEGSEAHFPGEGHTLVRWEATFEKHMLHAGKCILAWTVHRDPPSCPQCKAPFASLLTFRKLDGSMSDYPVEESVCLLKRAIWFEAYLKVSSLCSAARTALDQMAPCQAAMLRRG